MKQCLRKLMIQPKGWKKIIEFGAVEKSAALYFSILG